MSRELTSTGFIETTVVNHEIKIAKAFMTVGVRHRLNQDSKKKVRRDLLSCGRCGIDWGMMPSDGYVNLCNMKKGINICICDNCMAQIDENLKIK